MKKFILVFAFILATATGARAQDTVTPGFQSIFGRESTEWNGILAIPDFYSGGLLRTGIDTVIEGMQYKKVEFSEAEWWYDGRYYEDRASDFDFYLREDTSTGKLWCRSQRLPYEMLIADMSLSIGDTFMVINPYTSRFTRFTVVDTMTTDHRRTIVLRTDYDPEPIKFIEGVGCTNLFIYTMHYYIHDVFENVTCCHKDGELVYHWQSREDDSTCAPTAPAGIENREGQTTISVYPNPCSDKVWIDGENIQSATLLDMKGTLLETAIAPRPSLDMSAYPKGVYLLRLLTPLGSTTKKLIVQ